MALFSPGPFCSILFSSPTRSDPTLSKPSLGRLLGNWFFFSPLAGCEQASHPFCAVLADHHPISTSRGTQGVGGRWWTVTPFTAPATRAIVEITNKSRNYLTTTNNTAAQTALPMRNWILEDWKLFPLRLLFSLLLYSQRLVHFLYLPSSQDTRRAIPPPTFFAAQKTHGTSSNNAARSAIRLDGFGQRRQISVGRQPRRPIRERRWQPSLVN
jgi:hypothetical protein